ncbi:MAG TPA: AcvB/VirJ family lysyl-phosphatidylglycerol hydrolase [Steroidobacteraceae bacterium]|nr:AcvB/VirJ family lysyl-phosphatidylglycerol hydrolase [Steroidobacteraceae bacterium]
MNERNWNRWRPLVDRRAVLAVSALAFEALRGLLREVSYAEVVSASDAALRAAVLRIHPPPARSTPPAELAGLPIIEAPAKQPGNALVYSDDDESSCSAATSAPLRAVSLPGGHHFGGDYDRVAALILEHLH